jgi:hypothetical protein
LSNTDPIISQIYTKNRNISHFLATLIAHTEGSLLPVANTSNNGLLIWVMLNRGKSILCGRDVLCDVIFFQMIYYQCIAKLDVMPKIWWQVEYRSTFA